MTRSVQIGNDTVSFEHSFRGYKHLYHRANLFAWTGLRQRHEKKHYNYHLSCAKDNYIDLNCSYKMNDSNNLLKYNREDKPNRPFPGTGRAHECKHGDVTSGHATVVLNYRESDDDRQWIKEMQDNIIARLTREHEERITFAQELEQQKREEEMHITKLTQLRDYTLQTLEEGKDLFNQGRIQNAVSLFDVVISKISDNDISSDDSDTLLLRKQEAQSYWLISEALLLTTIPDRLNDEFIKKCFERTTTMNDFRLTYTLAMAGLKDKIIKIDELNPMILARLTYIAENRIIKHSELALFKMTIKRIYKANYISEYDRNTLDSIAESKKIFSDPRFEGLKNQVEHMQTQFCEAVKHFSDQIGSIRKELANNREHIFALANNLDQLREAYKKQAKRKLGFGALKMGLSFVGFFAVDFLSSVCDLSDLSEIGSFLLKKEPGEVEKLLDGGQSAFDKNFRVSHMNPIAEKAIKNAGYDPGKFVKQWYSTAVVLEKTPNSQTNLTSSPVNYFSVVSAHSDHSAAANTSSKVLPLPNKPLGRVFVLYAYTATAPDQLSVNANEKLTLIEKDPSGWWLCCRGLEKGLVPSTYLEECSVSSKSLPLPAAPGHR